MGSPYEVDYKKCVKMDKKGKKIGLALSGGGYRAVAYHVGTLRTLHKLGILEKVDVISSVSGGSITAAFYGLHKDDGYDAFEALFIQKIQKGVLHLTILNTILFVLMWLMLIWVLKWVGCILGLVLFLLFQYQLLPLSRWIRLQYDRLFFRNATLDKLPDQPSVKICSTDVATGRLFVFSKEELYGYDYRHNGIHFNTQSFPISLAVMASSCVPFAFSPITIPESFFIDSKRVKEGPLLIDGGLYDNQGAYKLQEKGSDYECSHIIVSDAGNSEMSKKWVVNTVLLLLKTSEILMRRIRAMQIQQNIFSTDKTHKFAYTSLLWNPQVNWLEKFAYNIKNGNVHQSVLEYHQIGIDLINHLHKRETWKVGLVELHDCLIKSIDWENLLKKRPDVPVWLQAKSVRTSLVGLNKHQINDLIHCAEWMTELQIKTYLPNLL